MIINSYDKVIINSNGWRLRRKPYCVSILERLPVVSDTDEFSGFKGQLIVLCCFKVIQGSNLQQFTLYNTQIFISSTHFLPTTPQFWRIIFCLFTLGLVWHSPEISASPEGQLYSTVASSAQNLPVLIITYKELTVPLQTNFFPPQCTAK